MRCCAGAGLGSCAGEAHQIALLNPDFSISETVYVCDMHSQVAERLNRRTVGIDEDRWMELMRATVTEWFDSSASTVT